MTEKQAFTGALLLEVESIEDCIFGRIGVIADSTADRKKFGFLVKAASGQIGFPNLEQNGRSVAAFGATNDFMDKLASDTAPKKWSGDYDIFYFPLALYCLCANEPANHRALFGDQDDALIDQLAILIRRPVSRARRQFLHFENMRYVG